MIGGLAKGLWGVLRGDPFWRYRLAEIERSSQLGCHLGGAG